MNSVIYLHYEEQFFAPDTDTKVPAKLGQHAFLPVTHDVTYSKPREDVETHQLSCKDYVVHKYDKCVLQTSDRQMYKLFGCYSPLLTLRDDLHCNIGAFTSEEKKAFYMAHDSNTFSHLLRSL